MWSLPPSPTMTSPPEVPLSVSSSVGPDDRGQSTAARGRHRPPARGAALGEDGEVRPVGVHHGDLRPWRAVVLEHDLPSVGEKAGEYATSQVEGMACSSEPSEPTSQRAGSSESVASKTSWLPSGEKSGSSLNRLMVVTPPPPTTLPVEVARRRCRSPRGPTRPKRRRRSRRTWGSGKPPTTRAAA